MASFILVGIVTSLAHAAAIPPEHEPEPHAMIQEQEPYVTVAPGGSADTITPIVTSIFHGAVTTISPIPEILSTKTSLHAAPTAMETVAPVAVSATSSDGSGAFLQCLTWDPRWFSSADETVRIQGSYSYDFEGEVESGLLPDAIGGTTAFVSGDIPAKQGFYVWDVDEEQIFVNSTITLSLGMKRYTIWPGRHEGYGIRQSRAQRMDPSQNDE
ncbi:hypothetical protein SLS62_004629 [Diatrype stigma]|uniref:Uncharacterized protein n=1 Tax=Diatrype stigma TaxID=117547 RepID=A0AAN9UQC2_9PEZI